MWQTILQRAWKAVVTEVAPLIIDAFLKSLAKQQGLPAGAQALSGPDVEKARAEAIDEMCR